MLQDPQRSRSEAASQRIEEEKRPMPVRQLSNARPHENPGEREGTHR